MIFGLGANVGQPEVQLRWAIRELVPKFGPLEVAPLYRSAPISPVAQADFLNTVVTAAVPALEPWQVLAKVQELERRAGRRPGVRYGPRPLDIDLLLFGGRCLKDPELELPHPRIRERRFVLAPLADLMPDLRLPGDERTVRDWLVQLGESQEVERLSWSEPPTTTATNDGERIGMA